MAISFAPCPLSRTARPLETPADVRSILFVCTANHCRSPVAEAMLQRQLASRKPGKRWRIASAGTAIAESGQKPAWRMRWLAWKAGLRLRTLSRQINRRDLDQFDLVIAMDQSNWLDLQRLHSRPRGVIRMFSDFLDSSKWPRSVPDPMARSWDSYRHTWSMLSEGCMAIGQSLVPSPGPLPARKGAADSQRQAASWWSFPRPLSQPSWLR